MRLLLVEDDCDVSETLIAFLEREGFVVDLAESLEIAREAIKETTFDLVILDRMLPDGEGMSLMEYAERSNQPQRFLLLTALDDVNDKITGLSAGANDYIVKPFEPRELVARIRNAMRYPIGAPRETRSFGPIVHEVESGAFFLDGEPLVLRRSEALVLAALMARPGVLIPRETLESRVYGYDKFVNANSLESQISRLRKTLAERTDAVKIHAVRGVGYRLADH